MKVVFLAVLIFLLNACGNQPTPRPTPLVTTAVDVTQLSSYGPIAPVVPSISASTSLDELRLHVIGASKGSDSFKTCINGQKGDNDSSKDCWKNVSAPSNTILVAIAYNQKCAGNIKVLEALLVSNSLTIKVKGPICPTPGASPLPVNPDIKGGKAGSFQLFSIKTSQLVNGSKLNLFLSDESGQILASVPASI